MVRNGKVKRWVDIVKNKNENNIVGMTCIIIFNPSNNQDSTGNMCKTETLDYLRAFQ